MKIAIVSFLVLIGVFGVYRYLKASNTRIIVDKATIDSSAKVLDLCIKKLNSEEQLCISDFKGKKVLIVNVASQCGFTYQYKDLEKLYETYKDKLVIIGFPCNQFGSQEPGTEAEIATFCSSKYDVTFPITTKVMVKGENQHPIYKWLTSKKLNGVGDYSVSWNFNKFLLDENGKLIGYFSSRVNPLDKDITGLIQ